MGTKSFKNYILILTNVNYLNWLDASPTLTIFLLLQCCHFASILIEY